MRQEVYSEFLVSQRVHAPAAYKAQSYLKERFLEISPSGAAVAPHELLPSRVTRTLSPRTCKSRFREAPPTVLAAHSTNARMSAR